MSRAKALILGLAEAAPSTAPALPKTKPDIKPVAPPPRPKKHPNPFRRREIKPGEEPAPKACINSKSKRPYESSARARNLAKLLITGE